MIKTLIKILVPIAAVVSIVGNAAAQEGIDRRIEVTRRYIPEVGEAGKLDFMPAPVDTVALHPEITYSVTPTPWKGGFDARPIGPVRISAVQYRPEKPFFLRLAAGYPLQSLADFYATATTSGDVAFGAYLNHYGRWAKIGNDLGNKENAAATYNVAGAFFEKRFARKTLSVDISDTYRYYRAFGGFGAPEFQSAPSIASGDRIGYNDLEAMVAFGDRFLDLSRFNYRFGVAAAIFTDREKAGENEIGAFFESGWRLYEGDFTAGVEFEYAKTTGREAANDHGQAAHDLHAAHRDFVLSVAPGYEFGVKDLSIGLGLDFVYNDHAGEGNFYIFPEIELAYGRLAAFMPYLRIGGELEDGCFPALSYINPYLESGMHLPKPSHYDFNVGAHGSLARSVSYDVFFNAGLWSDYSYFANNVRRASSGEFDSSRFAAMSNKSVNIFSFGAALEAALVRGLKLEAGIKANMVSQSAASADHWEGSEHGGNFRINDIKAGLGIPRFELGARLEYNYRERLYLSAGIEVLGKRQFATVREETAVPQPALVIANNEVGATVNLRLDAEYRVGSRFNIFLRGDNLLGRRIYRYNYYPELGASLMLGIKTTF